MSDERISAGIFQVPPDGGRLVFEDGAWWWRTGAEDEMSSMTLYGSAVEKLAQAVLDGRVSFQLERDERDDQWYIEIVIRPPGAPVEVTVDIPDVVAGQVEET